jgi:hypothetical protein
MPIVSGQWIFVPMFWVNKIYAYVLGQRGDFESRLYMSSLHEPSPINLGILAFSPCLLFS